MKISGKNNQFDNQHFDKNNSRKSDINYEEKDLANSPNPAEYLGRSQIVFKGGGKCNSKCDIPHFEPVKLNETPLLSKEDAVQYLKQFDFTDEDIKTINLDDRESLTQVSNFKAYVTSGIPATDEDIEGFKKEMSKVSPQDKKAWLEKDFSGTCKYANKENLDKLKNYFEIDDDGDLYNFLKYLKDYDEPDGIMAKIPYISYIEGKIPVKRLKDLRYVSEDFFEKLTPENVGIIKQINDSLEGNLKLTSAACVGMGDVTPELAQHYCERYKELAQNEILDKNSLKYDYSGDDLKTATAKMDKVVKILTDYPMDMSSAENGLSFHTLYDLISNDNTQEVQQYVNSLSKDAKYKGILHFSDKNSPIPKDKMAEICNIVYDKDYGDINEEKLFDFLNEEISNNPDAIDGLINLIKIHKQTGELNTYSPERTLHVENKDYENAAKATELVNTLKEKNIPFNQYVFSNLLWDKDTDFKELTKFLTYLNDNNLAFFKHDYINKLCKAKDSTKKLEIHHFAENKLWMDDKLWDIVDKTIEMTRNDEELKFLKDNMLLRDINERTIFVGEDLTKLLAAYQKDPKEIQDVLNMKTPKGNLKYSNINQVCAVADALKTDRDYTNLIINLKNCTRDVRRFGAESIKKVVEAAQIDKQFVNEMLSEQVIYNESGKETYLINNDILNKLNKGEVPPYEEHDGIVDFRYSAEAIEVMMEAYKIDKDFTKELKNKFSNRSIDARHIKTLVKEGQNDKDFVRTLLNYTSKDYRGEKCNRFNLYEIQEIINNAPENKEFLYTVLNKKDKNDAYIYNKDEIVAISKAMKLDIPMTKKLLGMSYTRYRTKTKRFEPNELESLIKDYKTDKKLFEYLLSKTEKQYNDEYHPLYDRRDIHVIMQASQKNKPLVQKLLNENKHSKIYIPDDIAGIVNAYEKDSEYTNYLLTLKSKSSDGTEYPLIRGHEMLRVVNAHEKNPEYTEKLLNMREKNSYGSTELIYSGTDIEQIIIALEEDKEFTDKIVNQKQITKKANTQNRFPGVMISQIVRDAKDNKDFANFIIDSKTVNSDGTTDYTYSPDQVASMLKESPNCDKEYIKYLMGKTYTNSNGEKVNQFKPHEIIQLTKSTTLEEYKKFETKIGENIKNYSMNDVITGVDFIDYMGKNGVNEVPLKLKKTLLRKFVSSNADLFNTSDNLKKDFPLLPQSQEEYCETLPALVRSLGIETNTLSDKQISKFNQSVNNLSQNLAKLSDGEYNHLTIEQEYDKNDFIIDILDKVKDLSEIERQKVYDYYGFELEENEENKKTGFSIVGYPVNLNNGKKLAEITDDNTKKVIEDLRQNVVKFSENNQIKSNNKEIEHELNNIAEVLPEIRTMIGKSQHGAHHFDVMKHSLKVMQKITSDDNFKTLNESDKRIMLLASLMHDITKKEGYPDGTHPAESSYDTFFIAKKFKLTHEEEIKLYTLIKNHEWLSYVNTAKSDDERKKRQQSVAFDLQQNNLFDMALMFTHADLKAVKRHDGFHDKKEGASRVDYNGEIRSFGEAADFHAEKIREYVKELQKSQPILPVTKMPKASTIEKHITHVNDDGSTNIKGVYKDKDGLVVVKFNEVENWEELGLPKGSTTKGIFATCTDKNPPYEVETGNIKFFVHGLDYANQLARFDAFSMVDSDALLSVSYAERPETKYRFFRAQGVMLDVPTEYVHGGGNTDAGSGCGKDIQQFKNGYIFGGYREKDRLYVSELVKEATGMSDEEYTKFVQDNKDKSMLEIEPKNIRNQIIKKFATINSNERKGNREYNEMYISNPRGVMGVFAYNMNYGENIKEPLKFLEQIDERTNFLKEYAKSHDVPFYVFGE